MMKCALAGAVLAACAAAPALALEHDVVIDHSAGPIAAGYRGSVTIETTRIGTIGAAGRPSTLRCQWTASLNVERVAKLGSALSSRRTLTSQDVAIGSMPGWCPTRPEAIDKLVDARNAKLRAAMLALVEQDRAALIAEAETATTRS